MKWFTRNKEVEKAIVKPMLPTVISTAMYTTGEMVCQGDVKVDGFVKGHLVAEGKVVISETGQLQGSVKAINMVVSGIFEGSLECTELLSLRKGATIIAEVLYGDIKIDPGVKLKGKINQLDTDNVQLLNKEIIAEVARVAEKSNHLKVAQEKGRDIERIEKVSDVPKDAEPFRKNNREALIPQESVSNW